MGFKIYLFYVILFLLVMLSRFDRPSGDTGLDMVFFGVAMAFIGLAHESRERQKQMKQIIELTDELRVIKNLQRNPDQ